MRIALFTTSFPSNSETAVNAGACVKDFAEALSDLGHEVEVLAPHTRGARHDFRFARTTWFRWLGSADSPSHMRKTPIGLARLGSIVVMGCVAARRLVRRFQPDHVLCFWVFPSALWARAALPSARAPYSVWALGSDIWTLGRLAGFRRVLRWLGRGATRRYADGMTLAEDFRAIAGAPVDFLPTSRVLCPPPGVATGEGGYYLFLGRYHPNKGPDLLIEAVGKVRAEIPPGFRLRMHGFGPLEPRIRARVEELGLESLVQVHGPTPGGEVAAVLRRARGLIIPSRIESIPLVLGDALQLELPLMVTDVGDMGTLVRRYSAGMVCHPEVDDIARTLLQFVSAPPPGGSAELRQLLDIRASARRFVADITRQG